MTLTDGYLNVIPHGRSSLAAIYLEMSDALESMLAAPYQSDEWRTWAGRYEALTDLWYAFSKAALSKIGASETALCGHYTPVMPDDCDHYFNAPGYSRRLARHSDI